MALQLIEGFDHLQYSALPSKGWSVGTPGGATGTIQTGRINGKAIRLDASSSSNGSVFSYAKTLASTYTTLIFGAALKINSFPFGGTALFKLNGGGSTRVSIGIDSSNHFIVMNGSGTTLATSSTVISTGVWNYIELRAFINGASGTIQTQLNGIADIGSTVVNIGSTNLDSFILQVDKEGSTGVSCDFDDIYVCDTSGSTNNVFLGDVTVETLYPSSDGAHTAFTPDTGTAHFSRVNENSGTYPDGDTSYVASATVNDIDTYGYTDVSVLLGNVYGVQTNMYARKDDVTARQIAPVVRKTGTDYTGANHTLTTSYATYSDIYDQDPTSTNWTISTVNAAEFGVKVTT